MSDYLFSRLRLGDIISLRYTSSKKTAFGGFDAPRDILVIAPNYLGHLHGIKMNGLSAAEQEYIQQLLYVSYTNPQDIFAPLDAQVEARKKEIDLINKEKTELIKAGQRVIVSPVSQDQFGMMDKAKQILGSVVGRVSTFGRTQIQTNQPTNKAQIDQQIQLKDQILQQKMTELNGLIASLEKNKQILGSVAKVSTDPYHFYHYFFKRFIGNNRRMKNIYRKFNIAKIKTPRILRSTGIMPGANRQR